MTLAASAILSACGPWWDILHQLGASHAVSEGRNLHLYDVGSGILTERSMASIPSDGLLPGHQIFNVVQHPNKPWLFVTSLNECESGGNWCWGNARIDRFEVTLNGLLWDGLAYEFVPGPGGTVPGCSNDNFGYPGQIGGCAPIGATFNRAGTRLYVTERDYSDVLTFSVSAQGTAGFLSEGDSTDLHGLAVHPSQAYLYNGSNVYDITTDTAVNIFSDNGGNATTLVPSNDKLRLLSTDQTDGVIAYDIDDPTAPSYLDDINLGGSRARDFAVSPAGTWLVAVGRDYVATIGFDGLHFSPQSQLFLNKPLTIQNRGVALANRGTRAVAAWFTQPGGGVRGGGATVYSVASDGQLTEEGSVEFSEEARVVRELFSL